ncbi:C6 zinc finger domain protein [Cordyceps fumosorosea ARSEF 2679]|uniref:C6 zinc finger domain protein n=1 Tax=Cordyceps fumosorosea (strain ARSEF 2679) TaxID=1081104 RepID=A0A162LPW9_CORFA|nr:C6 zinc finger domain protein [Cordyceps fumosorosea ARSEF 2679]OAA73914.1 C6 zinc finger domain protein [Cordyceps fumosorosea ARSEF 2679]
MVGVPRSTGCHLCRKRRVKCDEVKPACGNCAKYGAECPGYERSLKFVSEKHQVRTKRNRSSPGSSSSAWSVVTAGGSGRSSPVSSSPSFVLEPTPHRGQFVSTMVETARAAIEERDASGYFSWVRFGTVGSYAILDGALCALATHLVGKDVGNADMVAHSRTMYGRSLHSLQQALHHPTRWRASETLCTAILLCVFELFAGTASSDSWLQHARGIGILMEQRGAKAHRDGWDAAMLLSFRGVLIMSDLFFPRGDECFLTRPEWRTVMRDRGRHLLQAPDFNDEAIEAVDEFNDRLAEIPAVVKVGYPVMEAAKQGLPIDPAAAATTLRLAAACHARMSSFWSSYGHLFPAPAEAPSRDPRSPYPVVLWYERRWAATLQMSHHATMCLLQEFLQRLGRPPETFATSQEAYTRVILRSVEDISQGPLGPYRIGYALRIAYELADAEAQAWIRGCLDRFKSTYAATDKQTYPDMRTDNKGYR